MLDRMLVEGKPEASHFLRIVTFEILGVPYFTVVLRLFLVLISLNVLVYLISCKQVGLLTLFNLTFGMLLFEDLLVLTM